MLGAAPGVGPLSVMVARPYSSLDVALDSQATEIHHHTYTAIPRYTGFNITFNYKATDFAHTPTH